MQAWRVDLFALKCRCASSFLPMSNASCWFQPVWVTRNKAFMHLSSLFSHLSFSCSRVMSCLLGIKLHSYSNRPLALTLFEEPFQTFRLKFPEAFTMFVEKIRESEGGLCVFVSKEKKEGE